MAVGAIGGVTEAGSATPATIAVMTTATRVTSGVTAAVTSAVTIATTAAEVLLQRGPKTACQSVSTAAMCDSIPARGTGARGVAESRR